MFEKFLKDPYHRIITLLIRSNITELDEKEALEILQTIDIDRLFIVAKKNEVASIMYPKLELLLEDKLDNKWKEEYLAVKNRISWMIEMLKTFSDALKEENIPIVALKNSGIALGLLDDFGLSPMGDIDTLVRRNDFKKAHEIAQKLGFKFEFRSVYEKEELESAFADGSTEYKYINNDGLSMWLEISWRPIDGRWINQLLEPKSELLMESSIRIPNTNVRILAPEDNLLQVSIHTAKHSYVRKPGFRLHLDVDRVVSENQIDWDKFLEKVYAVRTKTAVYFSLLCAESLFNTDIPERVLQALNPIKPKESFIKKKIERMNLFDENSMKFSRGEFIFFQSMLYDDIQELIKVAIPGKEILGRKYNNHNIIQAQIMHVCDLVGLRKKK